MKKNLLTIVTRTQTRLKKFAPGLLCAVILGVAVLGNTAFAADTTLFTTIVKALGGISIAGAAIMAIFGAIAYAEAKSEGEGRAMSKAKNQITAAVMLAIVGIALTAGATTIAGTIKDITF